MIDCCKRCLCLLDNWLLFDWLIACSVLLLSYIDPVLQIHWLCREGWNIGIGGFQHIDIITILHTLKHTLTHTHNPLTLTRTHPLIPGHTHSKHLFPLTLKVLNFWKFTSYCSLKPLWSGMGEVVPARTSPTLHPHPLPLCINCRD